MKKRRSRWRKMFVWVLFSLLHFIDKLLYVDYSIYIVYCIFYIFIFLYFYYGRNVITLYIEYIIFISITLYYIHSLKIKRLNTIRFGINTKYDNKKDNI